MREKIDDAWAARADEIKTVGSPSSRFSNVPLRTKPRRSHSCCIAVFDWLVEVKSFSVGASISAERISEEAIPRRR